MSRNWDIMRNAANGADPYGTTRRMEQNRMRDRERFTSRDREEGFGNARYFDGIPDYGQSELGTYRHDLRNRGYQQQPQQQRGYVPSYGDEGFGRPSQGFGGQGYGQSYGSGYGYEHGESEALGDGGRYGYQARDRYRDQGMLGRIEEGIDRAFGNDWDRHERFQGARGDQHPSLWDRVKGAFTGKGPKNWTRSDERIREDVCECLTYHPHIDASEIDVVVKDGEVTLTGVVFDRRTKRLAEDVVEEVRGVRDVHNQIRVQRQTTMQGIGGQTQGTTGQSSQTSQTGGTTTPANQAWNQARR